MVDPLIAPIHEDARLAEEQARTLERIINGRGFTVIAESLNAVEAWLGSLPGHPYANVRQPVLHTLNLAHMIPVSAVWAGDAWNRHLNGPALIEAQTGGSTPFRLNLHAGDVGHTMIVGPTGAGKSVLLAMLALQWQRWRQDSKDGETPYLAVKLDDPSFAQPMRAAFFENESEGTGVMVWNRAKPA